ncbi:hypothetical protein DPMN_148982 [Dreissena polymorpha]|uniref:Uncharacterized protein n=1 Tax=Dreissena polymorpha TaxID=45954 RepID=A0A9D4FBW8_DREPO|nr:hypothetical protein DPMN_148982 [Dreissena polymorpha]
MNKCDVYLLFDRYMEFSTKSVARSGRQSNVSRVSTLAGDMASPPHNVLLGVTENKQQLIPLYARIKKFTYCALKYTRWSLTTIMIRTLT